MSREAKKQYCLCRRSDDSGFMIACDRCDEWFHGACVGLTSAQAKRIGHYVCPLCDEGLHSLITKDNSAAGSTPSKKRKESDVAKEKEEKEAADSAAAQATALRALVRNTLAEALFSSYRVDEEHSHPDEVARLIEAELAKTYGLASKEYKARYRTLLSNFKDARNTSLRQRILSGELRPDELCRLRSEDLAPKELAALRKQREEAYLKEVIIKSGDAAPEALPALKFTAPLTKDDSITSFIQRTRKLEEGDAAGAESTSAPALTISDGAVPNLETRRTSLTGALTSSTGLDDAKNPKETTSASGSGESPFDVDDHEDGLNSAAADGNDDLVSPATKRARAEEEAEKERQLALEKEAERERRREERLREKEAPLKAKRNAMVDAILGDVDISRLSSSLDASAPLFPLGPDSLLPPSAAPTTPSPTPTPPSLLSPSSKSSAPSLALSSLASKPAAPTPQREEALWKGMITNLGTPNFTAVGLATAAGAADAMQMPPTFTVVGRMDLKALLKYLNELDRSSTRRRSALLLEPATEADSNGYATLFEFLRSKNRGGVVQVTNQVTLKELFILPVALSAPLPSFLHPIRPRKTDALWVVEVLVSQPVKQPVSPPSPVSRNVTTASPMLGAPAVGQPSAAPQSAVDAFLSKLVNVGPPIASLPGNLAFPPGFHPMLTGPASASSIAPVGYSPASISQQSLPNRATGFSSAPPSGSSINLPNNAYVATSRFSNTPPPSSSTLGFSSAPSSSYNNGPSNYSSHSTSSSPTSSGFSNGPPPHYQQPQGAGQWPAPPYQPLPPHHDARGSTQGHDSRKRSGNWDRR